jgi:hypothetical protein
MSEMYVFFLILSDRTLFQESITSFQIRYVAFIHSFVLVSSTAVFAGLLASEIENLIIILHDKALLERGEVRFWRPDDCTCFGRHVKPMVPAAFAVINTHPIPKGG